MQMANRQHSLQFPLSFLILPIWINGWTLSMNELHWFQWEFADIQCIFLRIRPMFALMSVLTCNSILLQLLLVVFRSTFIGIYSALIRDHVPLSEHEDKWFLSFKWTRTCDSYKKKASALDVWRLWRDGAPQRNSTLLGRVGDSSWGKVVLSQRTGSLPHGIIWILHWIFHILMWLAGLKQNCSPITAKGKIVVRRE